MTIHSIAETLETLTPEEQKEIFDFIAFIAHKHHNLKNKKSLELKWKGALADEKGQFSSVQLQHHLLSERANAD